MDTKLACCRQLPDVFRNLIPLLADHFHIGRPRSSGLRFFGYAGPSPVKHTFDNLAKIIEGFTDATGLAGGALALAVAAHAAALLAPGGHSTVAAALVLRAVLLEPRSTVFVLSPSLRQSSELFRKVLDLFSALGWPVCVVAESALRLELANGSRVVSLPGDEKNNSRLQRRGPLGHRRSGPRRGRPLLLRRKASI